MATDVRVVLVTVPAGSGEEAGKVGDRLAQALVAERFAACVNRIPNLTSTYRWQGKVEVDAEELLVIKTTEANVEKLKKRIVELHPNEVPEVLVLSVEDGLDTYLGWVRESSE